MKTIPYPTSDKSIIIESVQHPADSGRARDGERTTGSFQLIETERVPREGASVSLPSKILPVYALFEHPLRAAISVVTRHFYYYLLKVVYCCLTNFMYCVKCNCTHSEISLE